MTELSFEDLRERQKLTSATLVITEADILAYASEFDPQPMHTDKEWAAAGPLGGLIASGWHTAAVAIRLQRQAGLPATGLTGIESLAWPLPVRPGDHLHAEIEIRRIEPERELVHFQNTVFNGNGDTVQIMAGAVRVPRRSMPAELK